MKIGFKQSIICCRSAKATDINYIEVPIVSNDDGKNQEQKMPKYLKLNFVCMCVFSFLTGCDFAVIIPTLWERLSVDYNTTGTFMGITISMFSLSGIICGFVMGKISDEVRKTKMFFNLCVLFAVTGHAMYFLGVSKYFILLSRVIAGLSFGAGTVALAYVARKTSEKQRTSIIALIMATRQLGLMFGPVFNLFLRKFDFMLFGVFQCDRKSAPGLFMFVLWSVYFLFMLMTFTDDDSAARIPSSKLSESDESLIGSSSNFDDDADSVESVLIDVKPNLRRRSSYVAEFLRTEIIVLLLVTFFIYFNQTSLETIVTPATKVYFGWNDLHNSFLFAACGILIIVSFVLVRVLSSRLGDKLVMMYGLVCIIIGLTIGVICIPMAKPVLYDTQDNMKQANETYNENFKLFPIFVVFVFFDVLGLPAIAITSVSMFTKMVQTDMQGMGQGIQRGVVGFATIVGPLVAGLFVEAPIFLFSITLIILIFTFVITLLTYKKFDSKRATTEMFIEAECKYKRSINEDS